MFDTAKAFLQKLRIDSPDGCARPELADRFVMVREVKAALEAYEARLVSRTDRLDDDGLDGAGMLRVAGRMSAKAANRAARTAARLEEMPEARGSLVEGRITAEHAATLADAAEKLGPEIVDQQLVSSAERAPADVFAKRSREFVSRRQSSAELEDEAARQRLRRSVKSWQSPDGMAMWLAQLEPESAESVRSALDQRYQQLYRDDGGRGGEPDQVRTRDQRMADALVELVTGQTSSGPVHPRHQVTVLVDAERLRAEDPDGMAQLVDGRALPQTVLERIACGATFTAVIADGGGRPLWVGLDHRSATVAQWKALIARDRGCVGCGADPSRCEAHHLVAWLALGPTDITNLVLLCSRCHHDVHDRGMELRWRNREWSIEPRDGPAPGRSERSAPLAVAAHARVNSFGYHR